MLLYAAEESVDVFECAIFFVVQLLSCLDTLKKDIFLPEVTNSWCVVCFLLGNSPASEFYMPTFRNTLSVPSS